MLKVLKSKHRGLGGVGGEGSGGTGAAAAVGGSIVGYARWRQ